jgi:hypothetical protein
VVGSRLEPPLAVQAGRSFEHDERLLGVLGRAQCGSNQSGTHALPLIGRQDGQGAERQARDQQPFVVDPAARELHVSNEAAGASDSDQIQTLATEVVGGKRRRQPSDDLAVWPERLAGDRGNEGRLVALADLTSKLNRTARG